MTYIIMIVSTVVGILQVEKLSFNNLELKPWIIFTLSLIGLIASIKVEVDKRKDDKYAKNVGKLNKKLNNGITRPGLRVGTTTFMYTGDEDTDYPFYGLDLKVWVKNNKLYISTTTRSSKGDIIVKIEENEWQTSLGQVFDKNFDNTAIEVIDNKGNVVLQAELNDTVVDFCGIVNNINNGDGFIFEPGTNGNGSSIRNFYEGDPIHTNIKPLFKYPSSEHKGERAK